MILTVTMNPSLDMAYTVPHLVIDDVNRSVSVAKTAGGKGLNVTRVLHLMEAEVTATGLIGGNIGKFVTDQLDETGISHDFYPIHGETRHSIAILHDDGNQTEVLESGPEVSKDEIEGFLDKYSSLVSDAEVLTISGSLPKGFDPDFYQVLIEKSGEAKVLLDTSGESLKQSLLGKKKPYLIKPNLSEIQDLVGHELSLEDLAGLKEELHSELFAGVEWIVISLGGAGAIAKHQEKFYRVEIPKINVVSPVGSGDSTLAGLARGVSQKLGDDALLKTGMVAGMLNTQEERTGWINMDNFGKLFWGIKISKF